MSITDGGLETQLVSVREAGVSDNNQISIPDMLGYLQAKTELTRKTLTSILIKSGRVEEAKLNPQQFLDQAQKAITSELNNLLIDGIKYERLKNNNYEMALFEEREIIIALDNMVIIDNSIYESIEVDSEVERQFAETMSDRKDIKLFIKLPGWFQIKTPLGNYNPD